MDRSWNSGSLTLSTRKKGKNVKTQRWGSIRLGQSNIEAFIGRKNHAQTFLNVFLPLCAIYSHFVTIWTLSEPGNISQNIRNFPIMEAIFESQITVRNTISKSRNNVTPVLHCLLIIFSIFPDFFRPEKTIRVPLLAPNLQNEAQDLNGWRYPR